MKTVFIDISEKDWNAFKIKCLTNNLSVRNSIKKLVIEDISKKEKIKEKKE